MTPHRVLHAAVLIGAVGSTLAIAGIGSREGPIASFTGAPAAESKDPELHCGVCHFGADGNNVGTAGGAVEIAGLPASYEPGTTYPLTVTLASDSTAAFAGRTWGFQLTAFRSSDGEGCGTFTISDLTALQVVPGEAGPYGSRRYVSHTTEGVRAGLEEPVSWTLSWRSPDAYEGQVTFAVAAVAGNGDGELTGDFVFIATDSVDQVPTPVRRLTWGMLKARFR